MSKFLLNLLPQFSKALVNSKIQFLIQKFFSFTFSLPAHAASRPIWILGPRGQQDHSASWPTRPAGPPGHPAFFLAPAERRLSLLPLHRAMGAAPLLPPHARKPQRSPPITPSSIGRNNTPSHPVMAAMKAPITAAARGFWPPPPPPDPYKRPPPPQSDSAPLTASLPSSLTLEHAPVEPHRRHHFPLVAPPLRRSLSSGEPRV
jgi:hypothetical protein